MPKKSGYKMAGKSGRVKTGPPRDKRLRQNRNPAGVNRGEKNGNR